MSTPSSQTEWNASHYARNSQAQWRSAMVLIDKLHLQGDETVLDIGCGDGKITAILSEKLPRGQAIAIDASANAIAFAKKHYPTEQYSHLQFLHMDAKKLQIDLQFDLIFSHAVFHWIDDCATVFKRVRQHLKPHGKFVANIWGIQQEKSLITIIQKAISRPEWQVYCQHFSLPQLYDRRLEEYQHYLETSGFQCDRIEPIVEELIYPNLKALSVSLMTQFHYFDGASQIPISSKEQLIDNIVKVYAQQFPPDEEGRLWVRDLSLEIEASVI